MVYAFSISTPANTAVTSKLRSVLRLELGVITSLEINFPPGSSGLLSVQILRENSQIFPKSIGDFHGDDRTFRFTRLAFPVLFDPFELYSHTWNTDDTFAHVADIYIVIEPVGAII